MANFILPLTCLNCNCAADYFIPRGRRFFSYKATLFLYGPDGPEEVEPEQYSHFNTVRGGHKTYVACRNCNVAMLIKMESVPIEMPFPVL